MFGVKHEKVTNRTIGFIINGLIMIISAVVAIFAFCTIVASYVLFPDFKDFLKLLVLAIVMFALESILTFWTFYPSVSAGPNSALLNLPLLIIDLSIASITGSTVQKIIGPENENFVLLRIIVSKLILITLATLRYIGMAWTDNKCCLKRFIAPIRCDNQLYFKSVEVLDEI